MNMDPRLRNLLRELYGDRGVTGDDHDLAIRFCRANEIACVTGQGWLTVDGVDQPRTHNKLLKRGPEMNARRAFNLSIPAIPQYIQLGVGTGAETLNTGLVQCQTPTTDAVLAVAAPTSITPTSSGGVYPFDVVTVVRAYGVLTGLAAPLAISEMSLLNTNSTVQDLDLAAQTGWGRILLPAVVNISATTNLTANYIVRFTG